jgi:hypothetical protein
MQDQPDLFNGISLLPTSSAFCKLQAYFTLQDEISLPRLFPGFRTTAMLLSHLDISKLPYYSLIMFLYLILTTYFLM